MSENDMKNKSKAPIIATIIVAVLAAAAVAVLIFVLKKPQEQGETSQESGGFTVTQEFLLECQYAAHDLVAENYEVMRVFVFDGLSHLEEPYGNAPEDGLYTVDTDRSGEYKTLSDIEALVKSVYTDEAAQMILHNIDNNGLSVYQNRKVLTEAEYESEPESGESRPMYVEKEVLGISADFTPDPSQRELWASSSVMINPTSETNCDLTIYLGGVEDSADLSAISPDLVVNVKMVKTANGWRLAEFVL